MIIVNGQVKYLSASRYTRLQPKDWREVTISARITSKRITTLSGLLKFDRSTGQDVSARGSNYIRRLVAYRVAGGEWIQAPSVGGAQ